MRKETKRILCNTPYNSYQDLFGAVFSGKANIRLSNGACRRIAATKKPFLANLGLHFGVIPSAVLTIGISVYTSNYLLLLLLLLELVFPFVVYLLNNFRLKTWPIAAVVVVLDLFVIKMPVWVLITTLSWLFCSWTVSWWQKKVYILSVKYLQYDEDAFEWAFNSHNLFIEDCYGNVYNKIRQDEAEAKAHDRLLKILQIGASVENLDSAIKTFFLFYQKKGVLLDDELLDGMAFSSKQQKQEVLLTILETGMGISGIENVSNKLIEFYKAKGKSFPSDI